MKSSAKAQMRAEVAAAMRAMSAEAWKEASRLVCERVLDLPEVTAAKVLMAYVSLAREIDPGDVGMTQLENGRSLVVPRCDWAESTLCAVEVREWNQEGWGVGRGGVAEPTGQTRAPREIDVILVPGMAFDVEGGRLGRGGGFYDRFLVHPDFRGCTIGLAADEQIVARVPMEEWDQRVSVVVTPTRTIRC